MFWPYYIRSFHQFTLLWPFYYSTLWGYFIQSSLLCPLISKMSVGVFIEVLAAHMKNGTKLVIIFIIIHRATYTLV